MKEELILVDIFDNPIGSGSKETVHKNGLLHRAFSIFVCSNGKMLIQQRNLKKYHSGGLWTNACCSHPRKDEEISEAVSKRLKEELGVEFPTKEIFSFVYRSEFSNGIIEYEYDHVFIAEYEGEVFPTPDEIASIKWISFNQLRKELTYTPEKYTVWFQSAAPKVLKIYEKTGNNNLKM